MSIWLPSCDIGIIGRTGLVGKEIAKNTHKMANYANIHAAMHNLFPTVPMVYESTY
jgi:hypothetical protein